MIIKEHASVTGVIYSDSSDNSLIGTINNLSGESYERGYTEGYKQGYNVGLNEPKQLGNLSKYTKIKAIPKSATVFTITNPLGGVAKKVSVIMSPYVLTSGRRCRKYIADYDLGIAIGEYSDTSSNVLYSGKKTTGTVGNAEFKITEGQIILYRYNSANAWDPDSEYEIEIYQ